VTPPRSSPDPYAQRLAFGQRLQILRQRKGITRAQLGGLLGLTASWVKSVESGRLHTPKLDVVLRIAEILRVPNLTDLTGHDVPVDLFSGPGHPRLAAVREAVDSFPFAGRREAPSIDHVRARLDLAWKARHQAPDHREVIGALLPGLIRDAQSAAQQADRADERRKAQALLSETYSLCQFFVAYQPDSALLWRIVERGLIAAQESEDARAIGVAAWLAAEAHRDSGPAHFDAADAIAREGLAYLEPLLPDAPDDVLAIAGALTFGAGYTAARRMETGTAWRYWDRAREMAGRLHEGYYDPITSFSRAIMGAHAVTVAVELHAGGESVRQATAAEAVAIPSRPRRARHRIEEARGYQLDGQPDVALATLDKAYEAAPETIKYNGFAKSIILEESESKVPARRRRASQLAVKMGMLAA
jgi:transcriptional regulator with XRE-family HTH domain